MNWHSDLAVHPANRILAMSMWYPMYGEWKMCRFIAAICGVSTTIWMDMYGPTWGLVPTEHRKLMEVKDLINSLERKKRMGISAAHIRLWKGMWSFCKGPLCRNSGSLLDLVMLRHEFGAYQEQMMNFWAKNDPLDSPATNPARAIPGEMHHADDQWWAKTGWSQRPRYFYHHDKVAMSLHN